MENLIIGQVVKIDSKKGRLTRFIRNNKLKLIISTTSILILSIYSILIIQFINLIKILKVSWFYKLDFI